MTYRTAGLGFALMVAAASSAAGQAQDFAWDGAIARGQTLEVRGVNGEIAATAAAGPRARVQARRTSTRGRSDPASVRIEVVEHEGGVLICAVYPTPRSAERPNECSPDGGQMNTRDNDVRVDFMVEVPAGVDVVLRTVNGEIQGRGLRSDVRALSVNGGVELFTTGFALARTVNGSIRAELGSSRMPGAVEFETVNGSITVAMPEGLDADFRASTVNGSIESDFPVTIEGKVSPRKLRGRIGNGGPELSFTTVNGSIRLRRR